AEDGIRDFHVTGVQTCALPILIMYTSSCTVKILVKGELIMDTMGRHVIGELWGCNVDILNDIDQIEKVFVEAALKSGAEIREVEIGRASCRERVERSRARGAM